MKKYIILGLVFLLVGTAVLPSFDSEKLQLQKSKNDNLITLSTVASTIIVDDEGDGNTITIQSAIDNADEGDIIEVYSGTYVENVIVDKQLTIIGIDEELGLGDDTGKPVIDGNDAGDVVIINEAASNVIFSGFRVINGGNSNQNLDSAIKIFSDDNSLYDNNISLNKLFGISLSSSSGNNISDNEFYLNGAGGLALIFNCPDNTILNNNFIKDGLVFLDWTGGDIEDKVTDWNSHTIEGNLVNGKNVDYYKNEQDITISPDVGQVILANCSNFLISNITFTNTAAPIQILFSNNNSIVNNNISNNLEDGIALHSSFNNYIKNNKISNNQASGIFISTSQDNEIIQNTIQYNGNQSSVYADILILLGGIVIVKNSQNNVIYNNNFLQNGWWQVLDRGNNNQYDNGTIGNFWSDNWYKKDNNHDEISDRPYYIPIKGIDHFPLMNPIGLPQENITPEIEIEIPKEGYWHIDNNVIDPYPSKTGITGIFALPLMSPIEIKVRANDKSGISALYVFFGEYDIENWWDSDCIKLENIGGGSDLFKCKLTKPLFGFKNLTFIAWDRYSNSLEIPMDVLFIYMPRPTILP